MKLVVLAFHFEYTDAVEAILDRHGVTDYVRFPMIEAKDSDGKHFGSQVFPGNSSVVHAQIPDEAVDGLLDELGRFREAKPAHRHLQAVVLPIERRL